MRQILVIRFGALGDLCLLARTLARAASLPGADARRVTLVTKAAFAPLLATARGVDEVVPLEGGGGAALWSLGRRLHGRSWDTVVDAHNILRGHLLLGLMGRRPDARLAKDTAARLRLLAGRGTGDALARSMRDRFDDLLPAITGRPRETGDTPAPLPFAGDGRDAAAGPPVLGLAPGARWESKRWPASHFAELLDTQRTHGDSRARVFLGPDEASWYPGSPLAAAVEATGAEVVREVSLPAVTARLAECAVLVTNDSGLLHLAEAVGTPVVALFGPTVRAFGYFPADPRSRVLETDLDCRPCSRNGRRPCHRGDLACLDRLGPAAVWDEVAPRLSNPAPGVRT